MDNESELRTIQEGFENIKNALTVSSGQIQHLGDQITHIDDRLARYEKLIDGNGRPPIGERLVHIEGQLKVALSTKERLDRLQWFMLTTAIGVVGVLVLLVIQMMNGKLKAIL